MTTPPPPPPGGGQPPFQPNQPPSTPPPPQGYPQQPPPQQGYPPQQPPQGYPQQQPPQGYPQQPAYGPPPGGFAPPPAPSYATPPPQGQHKLSGKLVAALVAAVVIVAGGVGAAFALSGGSSPAPSVSSAPAPPPPQPKPHTSSAPAPQPTSSAPAPPPTSSAPAPQPTTSSAPPPSNGGGNAIQVAGPVYVTPSPGWDVAKRGSGYIILAKGGTTVLVNAYRASSTDVTRELVAAIETYTKGTTGLQLGKASPAARVNGKNFTQLRDVKFQFQLSTQQGTATINGLFVEFLNPQTKIAAFCVYSSPSTSALSSNAASALQMIASIE